MRAYTPQFDNPYPEGEWSEITDFVYASNLHLCRAMTAVQTRTGEDANYVLAQPYKVRFKLDTDTVEREIEVPKGMLTDLSSVPPGFRWAVNRVGPHLEATIVHDFLYIAWQDLAGHGARDEDRKFADELMRVAMKEAKVSGVQIFLIHSAVSLAGGSAFRNADPGTRYVEDETGGDCPCEGAPLVVPAPPPAEPEPDTPDSDPDLDNDDD